MELTPGERSILDQLQRLYAATSRREHPLGRITSDWPAMQVEAYRGVLGSLLSKGLVEIRGDGQAVRITDAGLRAMGLEEATGDKMLALRTRRLGLLERLVFIALAACAIVLLWLTKS